MFNSMISVLVYIKGGFNVVFIIVVNSIQVENKSIIETCQEIFLTDNLLDLKA